LLNFGNPKLEKLALSISLAALLAACGGGGSSGGSSANAGIDSITLSGQVVDGPVAGTQVCLFSNGSQAHDTSGAAICSGATDAQGNYTMMIPKSLASGFLTLVATKGNDIKLASTLGSTSDLLAAAGSGASVSPSNLPNARVTHFTTADFALADTNNDGTVSKDELAAYVPDFAAVQKGATAIKAVIDFGQSSLIAGSTTNTLALAGAAGHNQVLGTTGQTANQWFADVANANIIAAVNQDIASDLTNKFVKYNLVQTATTSNIPPTVNTTINGVGASIYCEIETGTDTEDDILLALDSVRRIGIFQFTGDDGKPVNVVGNYNPQTGAINFNEVDPKVVSQTYANVTFYHDGSLSLTGTVDASGKITGTFNGMSATTWTFDATRQECTNSGTFTLIKL
jgi:hypothetical protein